MTGDKNIIKLIEKVKRMARYESNVLIYGETGTGKEIFAQSIHNISSRRDKPFIAQNCAAIPENLLESILFGTEKGSFTGAIDKEGLFEQANGGTLLLDELNSLPIYLQAKLLRVLQEKYIRRVGGTVEKRINVRIIATVNEEPSKLIELDKLRQDLFFRLNTLYICIPPLRERKKDIFLLMKQYVNQYSSIFNVKSLKLSKDVSNFFQSYEWSGNVRELINVIEYIMMTIDDGEEVKLNHLPYYLLERLERDRIDEEFSYKPVSGSYHDIIDDFERKIILEELIRCRWNVTKTAKMLNIKRQTLQNKIKKLKIDEINYTKFA
ncbi:sigma 54-interacting transcriptional regulator [Tissierella praeacuta]|uniref:sigma-54 interaction domain-containing protein n=1 Tax=Tissierella praeacuta TaxID=43131 RepID=UPI00334167DA